MFASVLVVLLLLAVTGVLVAGVVLMGVGGKLNEKYSNRLMTLRVTLQALTIFLLAALFMAGGK